jgi:hypothetical protein
MAAERRDERAPTGGASLVRLPGGAGPPFRVWVNGVEQVEGTDYVVESDRLRFTEPLAKEGRLGFWRWTLMVLGIAGTYRKNDSVDVQYELGGRTRLATGLDIEPGAPSQT